MPDGPTQGGHVIIFLVGEDGRILSLCWHSKKELSEMQSKELPEVQWLKAMFLVALYSELCHNCINKTMLPMEFITDSKSILQALRSNKPVTEKQFRVELCGIKQMIELKQIIDVRRCDRKYQLADCLTNRDSSPI